MQDLLRNVSDSYKSFSSGQKKLGDLFFREPTFLAFSSAFEVGKRVQVSESTVIRWTQRLGYKGYTEFQQVIQRKLAQERIEQAQVETSKPLSEQSFLENLLDADISSIVKLKKTMDEEKLLQVVDKISNADHIFVTGNFFDYGLVHWFSSWLNMAIDRTQMIMPEEGEFYSQLAKVKQDDLVIAFVFPRYTKLLVETLRIAKLQGAEIVILSDSYESPAAELADISLKVSVNSNLTIDSYAAVHALLTSIMRFVYVKDHAKVKDNLSRIEEVYKEKDLFIPMEPVTG